MLNEVDFHAVANKTLTQFFDAIEQQDASGAIDCELEQGILTLAFANGKQILASKHAPSKQIWFSSPLLGGLHFSWNGEGWALADGRNLASVLSQDIKNLANIEIAFLISSPLERGRSGGG